jgi:hypothetical protein
MTKDRNPPLVGLNIRITEKYVKQKGGMRPNPLNGISRRWVFFVFDVFGIGSDRE